MEDCCCSERDLPRAVVSRDSKTRGKVNAISVSRSMQLPIVLALLVLLVAVALVPLSVH